MTFREAFIIVGAICAVAGIYVRDRGETSKGLGMALFVVGCLMMIAGPVGSMYGLW